VFHSRHGPALAANNKFLAANDKPRRFLSVMRASRIHETRDPMIKSIAKDLRAIAERCSGFARDCRKYELSRTLQELSIELMTKASEIERRFGE
jgi:hypothetical protein